MKMIMIESCIDPDMPVGWNRAMTRALKNAENGVGPRRYRVWSFTLANGTRTYRVGSAPYRKKVNR